MFRGLVGVIQRILGNSDIGPVPVTVSISLETSDESLEQLRQELQLKGFEVGGYIHTLRMLECLVPKDIYEKVFNARIRTYRPFKDKKYLLEYEDLQTPKIPEELKSRVASVSVSNMVYAAKK